jgi:membrane associated rhomboid family serine protease
MKGLIACIFERHRFGIMTMLLPTPVYKRIPQFWFLFGLLFIANGLYLGLDIPVSVVYIAAGFGCCFCGVGVAVVRLKYRRDRQENCDSTPVNE